MKENLRREISERRRIQDKKLMKEGEIKTRSEWKKVNLTQEIVREGEFETRSLGRASIIKTSPEYGKKLRMRTLILNFKFYKFELHLRMTNETTTNSKLAFARDFVHIFISIVE